MGGGAGSAPVWTTATGTGGPVREGTPTLVTPEIGAATGTSLTLTGTLTGNVGIELDADGETLLAAESRGSVWINSAQANIYILPAAAAGLNVCFYAESAHAITITPSPGATDAIVYEAANCGTDGANGDDLVGAATIGSFVCMVARDASTWLALGHANTWTCE